MKNSIRRKRKDIIAPDLIENLSFHDLSRNYIKCIPGLILHISLFNENNVLHTWFGVVSVQQLNFKASVRT
jgi:hypothetical protein